MHFSKCLHDWVPSSAMLHCANVQAPKVFTYVIMLSLELGQATCSPIKKSFRVFSGITLMYQICFFCPKGMMVSCPSQYDSTISLIPHTSSPGLAAAAAFACCYFSKDASHSSYIHQQCSLSIVVTLSWLNAGFQQVHKATFAVRDGKVCWLIGSVCYDWTLLKFRKVKSLWLWIRDPDNWDAKTWLWITSCGSHNVLTIML